MLDASGSSQKAAVTRCEERRRSEEALEDSCAQQTQDLHPTLLFFVTFTFISKNQLNLPIDASATAHGITEIPVAMTTQPFDAAEKGEKK